MLTYHIYWLSTVWFIDCRRDVKRISTNQQTCSLKHTSFQRDDDSCCLWDWSQHTLLFVSCTKSLVIPASYTYFLCSRKPRISLSRAIRFCNKLLHLPNWTRKSYCVSVILMAHWRDVTRCDCSPPLHFLLVMWRGHRTLQVLLLVSPKMLKIM